MIPLEHVSVIREEGSDSSGRGQRPRLVEFVGIAGVGKTHLKAQLTPYLANYVDVFTVHTSIFSVRSILAASLRFAPLFAYLLRLSSTRNLLATMQYSARLLRYAWLEEQALRVSPAPSYVLSDEGWYHKLRKIRRFARSTVGFGDLPISVRERIFRADVVVLLSADPSEVCARHLRRNNIPVTADTLARQYERSPALGQWQEHELTREDLRQATGVTQVHVVEIDYRPDFDVAAELLPELRRLGIT